MIRIKLNQIQMSRTVNREAPMFKALCNSINLISQQEPILVKKLPDNRYEIVDGNKRVAAMAILKISFVDCEVVNGE